MATTGVTTGAVYDFFSAVLPPQGYGYYCVVELTTRHKEHVYVESIDEVIDAACRFDSLGYDTYFALSTFDKRGSRTANNARYVRTLYADLDCGPNKAFATSRDAASGLAAFSTGLKLPTPFVVGSGYGLHAYWPFVEPISPSEWLTVAENFKAACKASGFGIDYSVSGDIARVLRVPGTRNFKRKESGVVKQVSVRVSGDSVPFERIKEIFEPYSGKRKSDVPQQTDSLLDAAPAFAKTSNPAVVLSLQDITKYSFNAIVALGDKGCGQINHYLTNATQDGMEPLWRGVISIAKHCEEGWGKALELSALHPYDAERTAKKYAEIKGPYNCESFSKISPGICEKCPHFGKIVNPISLGRELKKQEDVVVEVKEEAVEVPGEPPSAPVTAQFVFPDPPIGYVLSDKGVGVHYKDESNVPRIAFICDTPLFATATYDRTGERYVQFSYIEHKTLKSAVVPMVAATGREEVFKVFAKIGVMVPNGQEAAFRAYIKATIAKAKERPPLHMPTSLGWQPDNSFAFNSKIYTPHGEREVPMYGFDNINETMGVKGSLDTWRLIVAALIKTERWDIISMMMLGFASPLMKFTGLNGITFHLCSNASGLGKTMCQRLASSVWGKPDKFRVTPNTSPIAMINRLGMLGNLPLMVDEITHKGRNETEWFPEFLSQMSDGRGKDRMDSQTNSERRNTTTWASIALMTSNKHMLDFLTAERAHQSEGEIRRLIEIAFDRPLILDDLTKSLLYGTLDENYGVAGEAYAQWLVRNVDETREVVKDTYADVFKNFNATGDERFWIAGCSTILAGIRLIGSDRAGIIDIPFGKVAKFLYETIRYMRGETKRARRTATDVLNEFTKRNYGKLVMVNEKIAKIGGIDIAETLDRRDLCGRVEKNVDGWLDYYIEEREIKSFCSSVSFGYTEFKKAIHEEWPVDYIRKDLLAGTKGPTMQVRCIHIRQKATMQDLFAERKAANG
jgi:hypothetical protein